MRIPSTRILAALVYERGDNFDPAQVPTPPWWSSWAVWNPISLRSLGGGRQRPRRPRGGRARRPW
jgi:hypothetical protein